MHDLLLPLDVERLRREWRTAQPYPHVMIEPFLKPGQAEAIAAEYPTFESARKLGHEFRFVNETGKIQVSDSKLFTPAVARLNEVLASPEFLEQLVQITGVPSLLADPQLAGGGMHVTGPQGRLDVHVDFNFDQKRKWHRRMNLLLYLNPEWRPEWKGAVEMWDTKVKRRHQAFSPILNRCVIFETSSISYHGVEQVVCPPGMVRKSFATYYYTKEAPPGWDGKVHDTIFRARPDEKLKAYVTMPAEKVARGVKRALRRVYGFAERRIRGTASEP